MRMVFWGTKNLPKRYEILFGGPGSGPHPGNGSGDDKQNKKSSSLPSEINDISAYKADASIGNEGLANETHDILSAMGLNPTNITQSDTDYGTSRYITIPNDKLLSGYSKIRISDHSVTNTSRMFDEIHLTHDNIGENLKKLELQIHPERYKPVEKTKRVDVVSSYVKDTDIPIKGTERKLNKNSNIDVVSVDRKYIDYERKEPLKT